MKTSFCWSRVGPDPMTGVLTRGENTQTHSEAGWRGAASAGAAWSPPETGRDRKCPPMPPPQRLQRRRGPVDTLILDLSSMLWGNKSLVCSDLLQQPWKSNPGGAGGKESTCQCMRCKRHGLDPWVWKIPWRRKWQPTPASSPGKSHGQRSPVAIVHGIAESDTTEP